MKKLLSICAAVALIALVTVSVCAVAANYGPLPAAAVVLSIYTLPSLLHGRRVFGMVYQNAVAEPRQELADFIQEGNNDFTQFKGLQVAPEMPLSLVTGHVPKIKIGTGDLMRAANRRRAPGTNFNRWQMAIDAASITLVQIAEEQSIPDEQEMLYEDYFDIEAMGSTEATARLRRGHEMEVAAAVQNATNFTSQNAGVAYSLANLATITFVNDILTAIRAAKARGEAPNTIIVPGLLYDVIRQSTDVRSFIAGTINPGAIVDEDNLQKAFARNGITLFLVPDGYVNQSDTGKDDVINPIWNNDYVWVGRIQSGALRSGGWGRTFYWDKQGPLFQLFSYRDEVKASNVIRSRKTSLVDVTNGRAGQLIASLV